ncbi:MAG: dTDP-4-dehydrorhamnose reductase [Myxococcota bacterium]
MKVFLTGGNGMLGRTLLRHWEHRDVVAPTRAELDLTDGAAVRAALQDVLPDVVVHCAAYTKVDLAETEADAAFLGNAVATAHVAASAHRVGAHLVTYSTDYVFAGDLDRPYHEWDPTGPKTVYGQSKLAAEEAVRHHCPAHTIIRIAWLYGSGGPSFLHTVARIARASEGALKMVTDQHGSPTSCEAVAELTDRLLDTPIPGTLHGTCSGECTWYDFAELALEGLRLTRELLPVSSEAFARPAPRPKNSRLENRRLRLEGHPEMPSWQQSLEDFLSRYGSELLS